MVLLRRDVKYLVTFGKYSMTIAKYSLSIAK